ncbi:MAG: serine--tRNA ligase [Patescibacteria group bacterium]|nr:serine--tRNA ligase [Patescibacteria group bacterium]
MLEIKFIRENKEKVKTACQNRGVKIEIEWLLELDKKRRDLIQKIEKLRAEKKEKNKKIEELRKKKEEIKNLEKKLEKIEQEFRELMFKVPNVPFDDVPIGRDEGGNVVLKTIGQKKGFSFPVKDYLTIAREQIDLERAAKTSGSRFYYLKDEVALLELKLINFAVNFLTDEKNIQKVIEEKKLNLVTKPFRPVVPPLMLKPEIMKGMGYLDQAPDETYFLEKDQLYLIGTAEQSLVAMHANEILKEQDLPLRYLAFPCSAFRREAGSYGKDVRGIFRVHQFEKVEMVIFCTPETSKLEHELLVGLEEAMMQELEIPYRIVQICTGDLYYSSAKSYDIEAWIPSQEKYRELGSSSNCTDFQARRLGIRYKNKKGKNIFVHTLNATALAIPRTIIAIIENYQEKEGGFRWPEVLC